MRRIKSSAFALFLAVASCRTPASSTSLISSEELETTGELAPDGLDLPRLTDANAWLPVVTRALGRSEAASDQKAAQRIAQYLAFLGLTPDNPLGKKILSRLLNSSTQFILCDDLRNADCLEQKPRITPKSAYRRDAFDNLGQAVDAGDSLAIESILTQQWDKPANRIEQANLMVGYLAKKIERDGKDGVYLAVYGIDDIKGSMKPVFDVIKAKVAAGVDVEAVVDTDGLQKQVTGGPFAFCMVRPENRKWIFDKFNDTKRVMAFQYQNSPDLLEVINGPAKNEGAAKARVEWPDTGIMHNKFIVLKNGKNLRVWTGTANVAETCMGTERNTNMGVYIDNSFIGAEYLKEFKEMWEYRDAPIADGQFVGATGKADFRVGSFHLNKTANTRRLFRFRDGTDLHLHFSPTDDAEHRSILPMILSAGAGDTLRISMFGGAGIEYVRAFQLAAARGAEVKIVLDRLTGSGATMWINDVKGNLLDENPYPNPKGKITTRKSTWNGLNHQKIGTLTHANGHVETIIIGSQNWTPPGNDKNDENTITIHHPSQSPKVAVEFNTFFDHKLWPAAETGEVHPGDNLPVTGGDDEDDEKADE